MTVVASGYERKHLDLYETEAWATEALLRHIDVRGKRVWEPAAGNGAISRVLRGAGGLVFDTDIESYDIPLFRSDFLLDDAALDVPWRDINFDFLITNPPYGKGNRDAVRWAELSLSRCSGVVALLLTAKFDFGKTRTHLFRDNPRFAAKIALLDRIQWFPGATTGTEDHAWYVWRGIDTPGSRNHVPPVIFYEGRDV